MNSTIRTEITKDGKETMTKPLISVVLEGYNESLSLGTVQNTIDALRKQKFPLNQVEVILVGSSEQAKQWQEKYSSGMPFLRVKAIGIDGAHYYELKNKGAEMAEGEIIALTDSDAYPDSNWIATIAAGIQNGADVVAGLTLFKHENSLKTTNPLLQAAASISWGFTIGETTENKIEAKSFLSHNVGFKSEVFHKNKYRTDLGRTCAGYFLYKNLKKLNYKILLQPTQQVSHNFSLRWWLTRLHVRFGHEIYLLRRLDKDHPNHWLTKIPFLEPPISMAGHLKSEIQIWLRFSKLLNLSLGRRLALIPIIIILSTAAHCSEMAGMYLTMMFPKKMERFAKTN